MSSASIRLARPGDELAIHEAHMRSIREICVKDHGEEEIRGWGYRPLEDRWVQAIKDELVWVVELNNKICGFGYIRDCPKDDQIIANIHALYLTPEVVGQGLARKLIEILISKAKSFSASKITLASSLTAHEFYKHFGFQDTGPKQQLNIGGYPVSYFPMELTLELK